MYNSCISNHRAFFFFFFCDQIQSYCRNSEHIICYMDGVHVRICSSSCKSADATGYLVLLFSTSWSLQLSDTFGFLKFNLFKGPRSQAWHSKPQSTSRFNSRHSRVTSVIPPRTVLTSCHQISSRLFYSPLP